MRILLGISGGIAAYKSAELVRRLRAGENEVRCALTRSAEAFVAPLTLEVLSGHRLYREEYLAPGVDGEELHISAARWAQVLCVAPATAHTLARLALGLGDDFLSTTALAFRGPLVLAPAMHSTMWAHPTVQEHVAGLRARRAVIVGPVEGLLASGETGMGRMAEPEEIVAALAAVSDAPAGSPWRGRRVIVTAGPTHEPLDPVRYIGNRSSGKMGFALAAEAARRGAEVTLISGPVALTTPLATQRIDVGTALEMREALRAAAPSADVIIMAAAVADFRPRRPSEHKLKRAAGLPAIELEENPDLLAELKILAPQALRIGFAAETGDLEAGARAKMRTKGVDFLVANDVSRSEIGFDSDDNEVLLLDGEAPPVFFSARPKTQLAADLLDCFGLALARRESRPTGAAH